MKLSIEAIGVDLTPALKVYVNNKFAALSKIIGKLEGNANAEVLVEISRATKHHYKGEVFHAEANIRFGKNLFRAEANGENMRAAVDILRDELKREIVNFKSRRSSIGRRGQRSVKKNLRLSKDARFRVKEES